MRSALVTLLLGLVSSTASANTTGGPLPIIGGTPTTVGQFPTVVALSVGNGLCTGTLIDPEWILTAAHCITPSLVGLSSQQEVTANTRVHFKTVNLNQSNGTMVRAAMTIPKPGFSVRSLGANDIGLIKLSTPVIDVEPTLVNLMPEKAPIGTKVTMVGFGRTGSGSVGVEFVLENRTSTSCSQFGGSDTNLLCFSQGDDKGKCQGDSGGPSFAVIDGRTWVVGVTSFGDQNCAIFGADTRTDVERDWLLQYIPHLDGCDTDADCTNGEMCFSRTCIAQPFGPKGLGTACTSGTECDSETCAEGPDGSKCSMSCSTADTTSCPAGFECLGATGGQGACWPEESGGCCDSGGSNAPTMLFGIGFIALVLRRRRR